MPSGVQGEPGSGKNERGRQLPGTGAHEDGGRLFSKINVLILQIIGVLFRSYSNRTLIDDSTVFLHNSPLSCSEGMMEDSVFRAIPTKGSQRSHDFSSTSPLMQPWRQTTDLCVSSPTVAPTAVSGMRTQGRQETEMLGALQVTSSIQLAASRGIHVLYQ